MSEKEKDDVCREYGCPHDCGCCPVWEIINANVEVAELDF